ncbi:hypothetical protein [Falsirhodobacter sp. 1013]|uniref:hypothetical protein n=1 Tax=Falsirhodobacter sp. 1013 TaxID=3417566 RepID=UPI003EBE1116
MTSIDRKAAADVIDFLHRHFPRGWKDWGRDRSVSCTMARKLLIALGHATRAERGAEPLDPPSSPGSLPRMDDTLLALLLVAERDYGFGQGAHRWIRRMKIRNDPLHRDLAASPDVFAFFMELGAVEDGAWTEPAIPALLRYHAALDPLPDFDAVPGLHAFRTNAINEIPEDVAAEMSDILEEERPSLWQLGMMDLLARRWRYPEGWLAASATGPHLLRIPQDALASWMAVELIRTSRAA